MRSTDYPVEGELGKVCHNVTSQKCHAAFCDADGMFTGVILTNDSPVLRSRDLLWPMGGQYPVSPCVGPRVTINQTISNTRTWASRPHTAQAASNQHFLPRQLMTLTLNKPSYAPGSLIILAAHWYISRVFTAISFFLTRATRPVSKHPWALSMWCTGPCVR